MIFARIKFPPLCGATSKIGKSFVETLACCVVLMIASGDLRADFMYDPLNPRPTESDVWAAERNARQHSQNAIEHNQKAAEAMGRDSWQSIEEQQKANEEQQRASRARRDADEMRNRIWMNEQEDRRRREEERRQEEERQRQEKEEWAQWQRKRQPVAQEAMVEVVPEKELTPEEIFAAQIQALQPSPYPGLVDRPGYCFMCGAHLLGRQRKCEKCKRHPPQKYEQWKTKEKWKAAQLKRLLSGRE